MTVRLVHATGSRPGAIAILQISGDVGPILHALTGVESWPVGRVRLVDIDGIDEGLAVRLREDVAQLMPHGGPRVVQRLTTRLIELGVSIDTDASQSVDPHDLFPEAANRLEAIMLATLAAAQSPLAINLLLDQPRRWRAAKSGKVAISAEDRARSLRLNRLIQPPIVVLAGLPNVGKSTLSNALLGRTMSIALDIPGTTRDYTVGQIDLANLVVQWHDTPGLRQTADPIELKSIEVARRLIDRADLLIAMADPNTPWPQLSRSADVVVINKVDLLHTDAIHANAPAGAIAISAVTGQGLPELVKAIRDRLVPPEDLDHPGPWIFDLRLEKPMP